MKLPLTVTATRPATLVLVVALTGCSSLDGALSGSKVDYRNSQVKAKPLEVPPDLSQLARDSRYQVQGGVVSAAAAGANPAPAASPTAASPVALLGQGNMRVERAGQHRWLILPLTPEQAWPALRSFWEQSGFAIESENAQAGVLETAWAEDRTKLPNDTIRNTIGRVLGNAYDTGLRDRFRMRIERTAGGSEVYISHRGLQEIFTDERRENTTWRARDSDPQLEAEMLSRILVALGSKEEPARATVAAAVEQPARARAVAGGAAALEVDEPFDRTWRRLGLALDRSGFTVEDRDRAGGLYYVRYVDPKTAGKEEPGFWARLTGTTNTHTPVRYRVAVKAQGDKTLISVLTSSGATDVGENGKRIATQLVAELR